VGGRAATAYAAILGHFVTALTGAPPRFSVAAYVEQHRAGLTEDNFWNPLLEARALRALELFSKRALALEKCPASVREAVAMAFGGITTQEGFLDQGWTPERSTTREPFSALCFYLSAHGMRGGRESAHQAQLQAEHIDPTAQLMGIDLRLLGIPASDMRVRSEEEVDEMLADIRELRREAGRESSRRADEQAAEMDSSGRLLGVHLRFLRIDSNDTRPRSEEEVTDLLLQFREASSLARSTWTEEEDELLNEIIAENPALAEPGAIIPAGLYVHGV